MELPPLWVFTPSRTDPKDLEAILVQRHQLLGDAVERIRESVLTGNKHHLLFVGPRGCGKTHVATLLVSRLTADPALAGHMRIAWLNEDATCTSLLELFVQIHTALERRYPDAYRAEMAAPAYDLEPGDALTFMADHLLASLGPRTLVLVAENLDALFDGLGDSGQKQLRAFLQENPRISIVATAQRLVESLADRASPFFGFFQTEHLKPLTVDEATELLRKIARVRGNPEVAAFLATNRGRARVRALHHLAGGNHRIYSVLAQFITRDSLDTLLGPFLKMVDELTPYYQERIRWLPPLQRRIVEHLCAREGTTPVKEIAQKLFATPQTISKQLQELREKGYVSSHPRGRESLYEISEPLLRICVEVKENQGLALPSWVAFLRVWYDLSQRGGGEPGSASAESPFLRAEEQLREGRWREGFEAVAQGLKAGAKVHPAYLGDPTALLGVVFSAGLGLEVRAQKVGELLRLYQRHQACPILGAALMNHLGALYRGGGPFPATDNLEGWAVAWEHATATLPEFHLATRLLRTGVDFLKAGGRDPAILLDLTAPERAILRQAFGLERAA